MSAGPRKITEAMLHAYVDGVLEEERREEVEAYLADQPAEAERIRAYQAQNEALRAYARTQALEPVPADMVRPLRRRGGPWMKLALAATWLIVGGLAGWGARTWFEPAAAQESPLLRQAAVAHVVFTPEVLHPVEVKADQEKHLVTWLSKRLGTQLVSPQLSGVGFELVGGRLLAAESGPAAQFMFQNQSGQRLTLYVRHVPATAEHAFMQYEREGSVGVIYWVKGPVGYALSGELEQPQLLRVAKSVYEQVDKS